MPVGEALGSNHIFVSKLLPKSQGSRGRPSSHGAFVWDVFFQVTSSINLASQNQTGTESNRALTPNAGQPGGGNSEVRAWPSRAFLGERRPHPHTVHQVRCGEHPGQFASRDLVGWGWGQSRVRPPACRVYSCHSGFSDCSLNSVHTHAVSVIRGTLLT